jgi:hypothetical protein
MKSKILKNCLEIARRHNNSLKHPQWDCYKHFSFIIQNNKIVEWGMNRKGDAYVNGFNDYSKVHSEIDAYFKARGLMDKSDPFEIVNIRLTKTFRIKSSNPCKCCWNFMKKLNCKRIWFTTDLGEFAVLHF